MYMSWIVFIRDGNENKIPGKPDHFINFKKRYVCYLNMCTHTHAHTHVHTHTHTHTHTALTPLERLIADTAEYCRERKAFGRPILDNQVVHYRLAELETEVEALRSLLYRAIGEPHPVCTLRILSGRNKATQVEKPLSNQELCGTHKLLVKLTSCLLYQMLFQLHSQQFDL